MRRKEVEALYDCHGAALLAYACSLLGDRARAEDAVQQVFLNLIKGETPVENTRSYVFRAVRNTAFNIRRNVAREVGFNAQQIWFSAPGSPETALALQAGLRQLPEEQREIIVMRIWGQMTIEEVAAVLETSTNTVASRYRYGLEKLRKELQSLGVSENGTKR